MSKGSSLAQLVYNGLCNLAHKVVVPIVRELLPPLYCNYWIKLLHCVPLCLSLSLRFVAFDLACSVFFIARSCLCFRTDGLSPNNHSQNNASEHWDTTQDYDKRSSKKEPNEQTQQGSQRTNDPTRRAEKAKSRELESWKTKDTTDCGETNWKGEDQRARGAEDWLRI